MLDMQQKNVHDLGNNNSACHLTMFTETLTTLLKDKSTHGLSWGTKTPTFGSQAHDEELFGVSNKTNFFLRLEIFCSYNAVHQFSQAEDENHMI